MAIYFVDPTSGDDGNSGAGSVSFAVTGVTCALISGTTYTMSKTGIGALLDVGDYAFFTANAGWLAGLFLVTVDEANVVTCTQVYGDDLDGRTDVLSADSYGPRETVGSLDVPPTDTIYIVTGSGCVEYVRAPHMAMAQQVHTPGMVAGQVHVPGAVASQVAA